MNNSKYKINITKLIDESCDYYDLEKKKKNALCEILTEIMKHALIDRDAYEYLIANNEKFSEIELIEAIYKHLKATANNEYLFESNAIFSNEDEMKALAERIKASEERN